jgi:hypothetical protein
VPSVRSFTVRVENWDYRELCERIADGVTLRRFTDFYCDRVPKHDIFNRGFNWLTPQTLKAINDMAVKPRSRLAWRMAHETCAHNRIECCRGFCGHRR